MTKTIHILEHIKTYCEDINRSIERFGKDKKSFETDIDYRNSICMSLLQIGELTNHLSEEFREDTKSAIYWPSIKGMRNLFAHNYGAIDIDLVWETVLTDIPMLYDFCNVTVTKLRRNLKGNKIE